MTTTGSPRTLLSAAVMILVLGGGTVAKLAQPPGAALAVAGADEAASAVEEPPQALTTEQQALVDFALSRFAEQGLELPEVSFRFHTGALECRGHLGLYFQSARVVQMCGLDKRTLLHELAHAWSIHNLTEERRREFTAYRGLATWNDHGHPWEERATEHAAEIIAWALLDDPHHVPLLETSPEGERESVHRLLSIPDGDVETLLEAFRWLTGRDPIYRSPADWEERPPLPSPEARRLGLAEQP